MMDKHSDILDIAEVQREMELTSQLNRQRNLREQQVKIEATGTCHNCNSDLFLEGQKYCGAKCAKEHSIKMKHKGILV